MTTLIAGGSIGDVKPGNIVVARGGQRPREKWLTASTRIADISKTHTGMLRQIAESGRLRAKPAERYVKVLILATLRGSRR